MAESLEASPAIPAPPCRRLRFKGMYVYTDGFHPEAHDDYDNTIFWCQKTLKDIGPDQGFVGREDCREGSRPCYEAD
ncbi:MAG: hypothetical protein BGO49_20950 [Planctomycetales bacterium 71-10]|nr:MAG: hypothetical protein BGO49_20950 [Planctomycetales bacterium 71-10]